MSTYTIQEQDKTQAHLNKLIQTIAWPATLYFPDQVYAITEDTTIPSNFVFQADNDGNLTATAV